MNNELTSILADELGYSPFAAFATAQNLEEASLRNEDVASAVRAWLRERSDMRDIREQEFSTAELMDEGDMTYPAALVFIDWLRTDPAEARNSLHRM